MAPKKNAKPGNGGGGQTTAGKGSLKTPGAKLINPGREGGLAELACKIQRGTTDVVAGIVTPDNDDLRRKKKKPGPGLTSDFEENVAAARGRPHRMKPEVRFPLATAASIFVLCNANLAIDGKGGLRDAKYRHLPLMPVLIDVRTRIVDAMRAGDKAAADAAFDELEGMQHWLFTADKSETGVEYVSVTGCKNMSKNKRAKHYFKFFRAHLEKKIRAALKKEKEPKKKKKKAAEEAELEKEKEPKKKKKTGGRA